MTTHSQADLGRLSRAARGRFPHAHMSDTKWRKLFAALDGAGIGPVQMTMKFIDHPEPRAMVLPSAAALDTPRPYIDTIEYGPIELRAIEWIDLPSTASPAIDRLGCTVQPTEAGLRIFGYSR